MSPRFLQSYRKIECGNFDQEQFKEKCTWRPLASLFIKIFPSFQKLLEILGAPTSLPNFEQIGQKLRSLGGVKVFHKTGSGAKSRRKLKNRFHAKCLEKWAGRSWKVSGKSNVRIYLRRHFSCSQVPPWGSYT